MASEPDPLEPLLDRWRIGAPPAADSLHHEIWRRIADAETGLESNWKARLENIFCRPSFALAFVAACALLGLFLAEIRVSHRQAARNVELAQAYVRLIDPLLEPSASHHLFATDNSAHD